MTVYVWRSGKVVIKGSDEDVYPFSASSDFPRPRVSRIEAYESPIDGKEVTSWGQRDRELRDNNAYDPRDMPKDHVYEKSRGRKP